MNKPLSEADLATPKVTTGPIQGSRKIYVSPDSAPGRACAAARDRAFGRRQRAAAPGL